MGDLCKIMRKVESDYPIPSYFLFAMVMVMEYTPKIVVVIGKMMTVFSLWWLNIVMENCTFIYELPIPDFRWYILSPWWWPLYGRKGIDSVKTRTWLRRNKSDDDVPSFVHLSWPMTFCNMFYNICFPVARQKKCPSNSMSPSMSSDASLGQRHHGDVGHHGRKSTADENSSKRLPYRLI